MMVVVGSDKNRGSARRGLFQKEAWDQTLKDANCRHGMDGCLRTSKNNEVKMRIPSRYIVIGGFGKGKGM